jgi:putative sterol carrier protein
MPEQDLRADSLNRLAPAELVELLERLDPAAPELAELDIDALGRSIDPRKLAGDGFVRLIAALTRLGAAGAAVDLSALDADTFARIIKRASAGQVTELLARPELRSVVLGEIFRRMGEHLRPDRAAGVRAVVHWRITGGTGEDGYDRYQTVIEDGTCTMSRERTRDPRVTITIRPVDLVKMITGGTTAPMLFLTGKVKIAGDLGFAAGLTNLFDLPKG